MKIIILGKKNMVGSTPAIRIKGISQIRYNFIWDADIRYFAYEPKSQKECDDIFRTQGRTYRTMFFSVWLEVEEKEKKEEPKPKSKLKGPKMKAESQPVEELVIDA
jgi:hypothetical protein